MNLDTDKNYNPRDYRPEDTHFSSVYGIPSVADFVFKDGVSKSLSYISGETFDEIVTRHRINVPGFTAYHVDGTKYLGYDEPEPGSHTVMVMSGSRAEPPSLDKLTRLVLMEDMVLA